MADVPQIQGLLRGEHGDVAEVFRDLVVVAALHPARHAGAVEVVLERVPAGLRDHVDHRAADFRLPEAAGGRHDDFLRVLELPVARHAAAVDGGPRAEPVQLGLPLVLAPAAAAEDDHPGAQLHVGNCRRRW